MDLTVWPAAQAVNFYVVPGQYRVAYVSFVALLWNIFLSYISHKVNVYTICTLVKS
jgi:protein Mpv17